MPPLLFCAPHRWSELRLGLVSSALDWRQCVEVEPGGRAVVNAMTHDFVRPSQEVQLRRTFSALISGLQTGLASWPVYWPVHQVQLHRVSGACNLIHFACCVCSRLVARFPQISSSLWKFSFWPRRQAYFHNSGKMHNCPRPCLEMVGCPRLSWKIWHKWHGAEWHQVTCDDTTALRLPALCWPSQEQACVPWTPNFPGRKLRSCSTLACNESWPAKELIQSMIFVIRWPES